jgi:hypothetical protein
VKGIESLWGARNRKERPADSHSEEGLRCMPII